MQSYFKAAERLPTGKIAGKQPGRINHGDDTNCFIDTLAHWRIANLAA